MGKGKESRLFLCSAPLRAALLSPSPIFIPANWVFSLKSSEKCGQMLALFGGFWLLKKEPCLATVAGNGAADKRRGRGERKRNGCRCFKTRGKWL